MVAERIIGIDFDNTIIAYDEVFLSMALERGLIDAGFRGNKREVRDAIRLLPDGERAWQQLQGQVYGKGIAGARLFKGVDLFLRRCRRENAPVYIVSHKTELGHDDLERVNLRGAARDWMTNQGLFSDKGYGIPTENVYFEDTRKAKLERIAHLGCTHFVDDLLEVLTDPDFPRGVDRILFAEGETTSQTPPYVVCPTWRQIEEYLFRVPG
jgi:hypothetical protein